MAAKPCKNLGSNVFVGNVFRVLLSVEKRTKKDFQPDQSGAHKPFEKFLVSPFYKKVTKISVSSSSHSVRTTKNPFIVRCVSGSPENCGAAERMSWRAQLPNALFW
jgi:hypothetical protein